MKNGKKAPRLGGLAAVMAGVAVAGMAALWLAACNADIKDASTKQPMPPPP